MTTAEDVHACIRRYPGIHLRGIERELDLSSPLVHYHVKQLEKGGRIVSAAVGGYTRYYATDLADVPKADRELLAVLREEVPLHMVLVLLDRDEMSQTELGEALGLAKSTVSYHVEKMVARGIVARREGERGVLLRVKEARRLRRLLLAHEPTDDLRRRFSRLWDDFYGP